MRWHCLRWRQRMTSGKEALGEKMSFICVSLSLSRLESKEHGVGVPCRNDRWSPSFHLVFRSRSAHLGRIALIQCLKDPAVSHLPFPIPVHLPLKFTGALIMNPKGPCSRGLPRPSHSLRGMREYPTPSDLVKRKPFSMGSPRETFVVRLWSS